jgi:chromodomain-containing protein
VFHINLLTPYKETEEYGQAYTRPPLITVQSEEEYEVESILQARRKAPGDSIEYKVHWKGYPSADDLWVSPTGRDVIDWVRVPWGFRLSRRAT